MRALATLAVACLGGGADGALGADAGIIGRIDACMGELGQAADHAEFCMGVHAEPCMQATENQSTHGMVQCLATETEAWDEVLNREYAALIRALDEEQTAALRDAQRKWMAFRDADCAFPDVLVRGSMALPWMADCVMQHTARRALELRGFRNFMEY